jgi:hypothetical protein
MDPNYQFKLENDCPKLFAYWFTNTKVKFVGEFESYASGSDGNYKFYFKNLHIFNDVADDKKINYLLEKLEANYKETTDPKMKEDLSSYVKGSEFGVFVRRFEVSYQGDSAKMGFMEKFMRPTIQLELAETLSKGKLKKKYLEKRIAFEGFIRYYPEENKYAIRESSINEIVILPKIKPEEVKSVTKAREDAMNRKNMLNLMHESDRKVQPAPKVLNATPSDLKTQTEAMNQVEMVFNNAFATTEAKDSGSTSENLQLTKDTVEMLGLLKAKKAENSQADEKETAAAALWLAYVKQKKLDEEVTE